MLSLLATSHPGSHAHPHHSDWLSVIADSPMATVAIAAAVILAGAGLWRALARR